MPTLPIEGIKKAIGQDLGSTNWLTIFQEQVNHFAASTLDHQYIHVDDVKAAQSQFGGTIAHGFLTLSLLSHFSETLLLVPENTSTTLNYGFNKVRFLMPVSVGKRVRCKGKLLGFEEKKAGQFLMTTQMTIEIEGEEKPALIADWLTMDIVT